MSYKSLFCPQRQIKIERRQSNAEMWNMREIINILPLLALLIILIAANLRGGKKRPPHE